VLQSFLWFACCWARESVCWRRQSVSTSSSTITHAFTITFCFLSFLLFPFLPSNSPVLLFSPPTLALYCTFLTRFASPKLPTPHHSARIFQQTVSTVTRWSAWDGYATDSRIHLTGFCSHNGEPNQVSRWQCRLAAWKRAGIISGTFSILQLFTCITSSELLIYLGGIRV